MGKDQELLQAVREQDVSVVKKLLTKGRSMRHGKKLIGSSRRLNVNYQDSDGMSCLHQSALMGNTAIMQILLDNGATVALRDNKGMFPLHYAAWQGKPDPVAILLKWASPVSEQAESGESPLHLSCQHGHYDVVSLLLNHQADPTITNKTQRTPLDLSCEFGRYRVSELLVNSNYCQQLLGNSDSDIQTSKQSTCLHLAAKNGHVDIVKLLLQAGANINRSTLEGTCLHVAALFGKIEVVKLLLDCGADVNKANSYDQTALDIVNQFTASRAAKELKQLLKEASFVVYARAVKDYDNTHDCQNLSFKEGDYITILEQRPDGVWKGYIMHDGHMTKTGFFPSDAVVVVDSSVQPSRCSCGLYIYESLSQSTPTLNTDAANKARQILCRKPAMHHHRVSDFVHRDSSSHNGSTNSVDRNSYGSIGEDKTFPPPPSPLIIQKGMLSGHSENCVSSAFNHGAHVQYMSGARLPNHNPSEHVDWAERLVVADDYRAGSPQKDSPSSSNRNSAASSDSGRGVSTNQLDTRGVTSQHRLSGQSYESGVSSRQSYHSNSSSSSLGSLDALEESGYSSQINVAELFQAGLPDSKVMLAWLSELHFEDYFNNFMHAGYDMPTISRMTPEDLTAIGITKPAHRKKLKSEIARLHISDGIPEYKPMDVFDWLRLLDLTQYYDTLISQGFENMDFVTDITWEDLEDIGIQKLGHQKKIMLAIDRIKRINSGVKRLSSRDSQQTTSEILEPLSQIQQIDVTDGAQYSREVAITTITHRKSPSNDNVSLITGPELRTFQHSGKEGVGPEFTCVGHATVHYAPTPEIMPHSPGHSYKNGNKRTDSPSAHEIAANHCPSPEKSSSKKHPPPVMPKVLVKGKASAQIVAKTKRSSRESTPEIIDVNSDSEHLTPTNTLTSNGTLKRGQNGRSGRAEHIYDKPLIRSPKSPVGVQQSFVFPKSPPPIEPKSAAAMASFQQKNMLKPINCGNGQAANSPAHVLTNGPWAPNVTSPLYVTTNVEAAYLQPSSPKHPSPSGSEKNVSPHNMKHASVTGAMPVQSKRVPPPPPPKRTHSVIRESPLVHSPVQRDSRSSSRESTPVNDTSAVAASATAAVPTSTANNTTITSPMFNSAEPERQQQNFSNCVKSLSEKFGKRHDEKHAERQAANGGESADDTPCSSDSEDFPPPPPPIAMDIITPKLHNYGILGSSKACSSRDSPDRVITGVQVYKVRTSNNTNNLVKSHKDDSHSQVFPSEQDRSTHNNNNNSSASNLSDYVERTLVDRPAIHNSASNSVISDSPMELSRSRTDSPLSFDPHGSTCSIDSNTLPFANENVGTIKQKPANSKPSIVECADDSYSGREINLNSHMFDESDTGTVRRSHSSAADHPSAYSHARAASYSETPQVAAPPVQLKSWLQTNYISMDTNSIDPRLSRPTETGDVLNDIDNMLQDLTDELDAMLELEVTDKG